MAKPDHTSSAAYTCTSCGFATALCVCSDGPRDPETGRTPSAATTELRALLTQGAVHDPPWHVADDHGTPYIRGKHGPGWYDCVAEEVSNEETANLIVAVVNALPALLDEIERLRDALDEIDAQTSGAFTGEPQTLNRLAAIRAAIDTVKDVS